VRARHAEGERPVSASAEHDADVVPSASWRNYARAECGCGYVGPNRQWWAAALSDADAHLTGVGRRAERLAPVPEGSDQ
jgi:hypothetical protein